MVGALAPRADSLAVRFVSDREIRRLNRTYRHHDQPTDVLSFPGGAQPGGAQPVEAASTPAPLPAPAQLSHLGDVAVSVPTARRQAVELGHSVEKELRTLLLHGILHCLGYDHETDDGTMDREERRWRSVFVDRGDGGEDGGDDD